MKKFVLYSLTLASSIFLGSCSVITQEPPDPIIGATSVDNSEVIVKQEKLNHFYSTQDNVCVIGSDDGNNSNGIVYKNSGAYLKQVLYTNFAQRIANVHLINVTDAQYALSQAQSVNCNIIVAPLIVSWGKDTRTGTTADVYINTYDVGTGNLLNSVRIISKVENSNSNKFGDIIGSHLSTPIATYIHEHFK